ncbi:hypothetical protein JYT91_01170 [archaeon AH-315-M20]|nr:hypothetical protein [archaeon AH-315-M20]
MNNLKHFARLAVLLLIFLVSINLVLGLDETTVLIVDDNDAEPFGDGITSQAYYRDIISNITNLGTYNDINYSITYWNQTLNGSLGLSYLQSFATVVWTTGEFFEFTPSVGDIVTLENYVEQGGKLIISGEFMLFDWEQNSFTDNVLHANSPGNDFGNLDSINITNASHPVTQGFAQDDILTFIASPGSFNHIPDELVNVIDGAHVLAVRGTDSTNTGTASLVVFENESTGARVVYIPFSIYLLNNSNRSLLVQNAMKWMDDFPPKVHNITLTPGDADGLDPDVQINFTVNATDLYNVSDVILTYKCAAGAGTCSPGTDTFTNVTMFYNTTTRLWENASFTPDVPGTWQYKIFVNDTLGNQNYTDTFNLSIEYDYSWTRTPSKFDNLACGFSKICTVGNLTINNTGDFTLNFDLSSNFVDTSFNLTDPFDLAAKDHEVIEVNLTAGSAQAESSVVITIDATTANADPDEDTTNMTFTASAGGPVFELTIINPPAEANKSDPGAIYLNASLKNIGNETANYTWINWTLPANWLNISGTNLTKNISNVSVNEIVFHNITVNLTSDAATGTQKVNVTAASNNNASDSATASIVVTETSTITTTITTTTTTGGGGGTTGGGGGSAVPIVKPEKIEISQVVELVRGEGNNFTIDVTNTFEDSILENLTIQVEGFLSQYLTTTPDVITALIYKQSRAFTVTVSAPTYKGYEEHILNATVTGMLIKTEKIANFTVTSRNPFTLKNYISLIIHEISKEEADISLEEAAKAIDEMQQAGFQVKKSLKLLEEAKEKLNIGRYQLAKEVSNQIIDIRDNAFSANSLMEEMKSKILKAENKGLQVEETKRLLNLALAAFEREDFLTAIQRTKDSQLSIVIETKGKINIVKFIIDNWFPILIALIILSISGYFVRKQLTLLIISRRLEDLQKEEVTINELMKEVQEKHYKDKKISTTEYHKAMYGYEKRLDEISQLITRLRSKRVGIIKISNEIKNLKKEDEKVVNLIKQLQDAYYNRQKITKRAYLRKIREYKLRRTEIEKTVAVLEAKLAKKEKLEELKAKEVSKKEIISEIKKKEVRFKKRPPETKPKSRFSFKNFFKRKKDDSREVKKILDELIKKKDKPEPISLLPKKQIEPTKKKIQLIKRAKASIKDLIQILKNQRIFRHKTKEIEDFSGSEPIPVQSKENIEILKNELAIKELFSQKENIIRKIIKKLSIKNIINKAIEKKKTKSTDPSIHEKLSAHYKKEIISKLKSKFQLDKIKSKHKKDYSEDIESQEKQRFSGSQKSERFLRTLKKHGFEVEEQEKKKPEPKHIIPKSKSHTKRTILRHLREVHKHG